MNFSSYHKSAFKKRSIIQIWFLDDDLVLSAKYHTNKALNKSIDGCFKALISAWMYFSGIRTSKFYKHFFSKANWPDTKDRLFPDWPMQKIPSFVQYNSKCSKWCRQCREHYEYILNYMQILLDEYQFRFKKQHAMQKFIDWSIVCPIAPNIPYAKIKSINLPWKDLKIKYRRKNIVDGYRLQFMNSFEKDPFDEYNGSMRDIPKFVVDYFNLNIAGLE